MHHGYYVTSRDLNDKLAKQLNLHLENEIKKAALDLCMILKMS